MRNPAFISRQIGDFQVMALSDGSMAASLTLLSGINSDDALEIQRHAGIIAPDDIDINAYLIRGQGRTILVDAGTGGGTLAASLQAAGVGAEEIDTVLLTHGHPDHIGGLLDAHGAPCFPNARLHLHPLEAEYWQDDGMLNRANERGQRNFALARRTLGAWARRLSFLDERGRPGYPPALATRTHAGPLRVSHRLRSAKPADLGGYCPFSACSDRPARLCHRF